MELNFDESTLDEIAEVITQYCETQKDIMRDYLSSVRAYSATWTDERTIGPAIDHVQQLQNEVEALMAEIVGYYPAYFRQKADALRSRPGRM